MRRTLLTLTTLLVLGALFTGSWYVTGMLRGSAKPDATISPNETGEDGNPTPAPDVTTLVGEDDVLDFPLPADIFDFELKLRPVMARFGVNSFSAARVVTYAGIAWYETRSPGSAPTFIAPNAGAQDGAQALLAAGAVAVELLDTPQIAELVDAWDGDLSESSAAVVAAVVAFADADGFEATTALETPKFDGDFGWKPGGNRHGTPGGYEPAYGNVRTVSLDLAACPVEAAPLDAIRAEREALTGVDRDVPAPTLGDPSRFTTLAFAYMNRVLAPDKKAALVFQGQNLAVMLHDSLIATWKANWENGVAAPIDLFADGDANLMSSHPSYPSWAEVAIAATESYVSALVGEEVTTAQMIDFLLENHESKVFKDRLGLLRKDLENSTSPTHHWNADREAGRKLGNCIAGEALKALSK
jgi:hypothetical protein